MNVDEFVRLISSSSSALIRVTVLLERRTWPASSLMRRWTGEYKYFIDDISQIPDSFHRRIAAKELDKIITFWCNCRYGANRWTVEEDVYASDHNDE